MGRRILLSIAGIALFAATFAQGAPSLSLKITGDSEVDGVDNFVVVTTVTNTGDQNLTLFNEPHGVLSTLPERTFNAKARSNGHATFVGLIAKYSFKFATSFTTLNVGESVNVTHHLDHAYSFDSNGEWDIVPTNKFYYRGSQGEHVLLEAIMDVESHLVKLNGSLHSKYQAERKSKLPKRATFSACDSVTQQPDIVQSLNDANLYLATADKYLSQMTGPTERYETWFGTYSTANRDTVLSHYSRIKTSNIKAYTFQCDCIEDSFAFVYPDEFGIIHLCAAYWLAPPIGEDSKAGTIIHESTHFTLNGGTDDFAYGHRLAMQLALTDPATAIMNADSHEYFVENTNPTLE